MNEWLTEADERKAGEQAPIWGRGKMIADLAAKLEAAEKERDHTRAVTRELVSALQRISRLSQLTSATFKHARTLNPSPPVNSVLTLVKESDNAYRVRFHRAELGSIERHPGDGWMFWPDEVNTGAWQSWVLKEITRELDKLNKVEGDAK
jgi:hypothetical protein